MAQYQVKNSSHLDKAFKVRGGHQVVPAGKTADVLDARELTEAQIDAFARDKVKVTVKGAKAKEGDGGEKSYEDMTRAELDALAAERKVDVKDAKNKGDVIAALQLADEAGKAQ